MVYPHSLEPIANLNTSDMASQRHQIKMSNGKHSQSQGNSHPSGLLRALEATGRTRGSAATPQPSTIVSPSPDRSYQARSHLGNMNTLPTAPRNIQSTHDNTSPLSTASPGYNRGSEGRDRQENSSTTFSTRTRSGLNSDFQRRQPSDLGYPPVSVNLATPHTS
jgi:hypothetical protein